MSTQLAVTLRGMRFHTLAGILPHERELPQPLEVDLTAWLADGAEPLDYRRLYALTAEACAGGTGLLETLADRLALETLALGDVTRVEVAIRKPHVMLPGPLDFAEVRLARTAAHEVASDAG